MRGVAASRISAAALGVAVTAVVVTGCSASPFPTDAAAYLPDGLAGRTVVVDDSRAAQVAEAISGDGVGDVRAAALVASDDDPESAPPVLAVADVDAEGAATVDAAVFRPVDEVRTVRIGGEEMRTARSRQAGRDVEFTVWRPADGLVVVAAGVDGGRRAARDALAALVTATRPGGAG